MVAFSVLCDTFQTSREIHLRATRFGKIEVIQRRRVAISFDACLEQEEMQKAETKLSIQQFCLTFSPDHIRRKQETERETERQISEK